MIGNKKVEKRTQLYHHDNSDLEFIKRDIVGVSTTEIVDTFPIRSWIDYYETLYPFDGYKTIPADYIQLAYGRHFHLELHDILDEEIRPPEKLVMDCPFLAAIAEHRAIEITQNSRPRSVWEKMTWVLGLALILQLLIWGIAYVAT